MANFRSFRGYRIKQSADNPGRFWIVSETTGKPVEIGKDRKGQPIMWLEPSTFDEAEKWIADNLAPVTVSETTAVDALEVAVLPAMHLEFDGPVESNMPTWARDHVDALFADAPEANKNEWTHSGMAWAFAEKMNSADLEEFVYCLNQEIKRRSE